MFRHLPVTKSRNHHQPFPGLAVAAVALFMLLAAPLSTSASQATLAWDLNSGPSPAGYKVYSGTSSRNYAFNCDAGNTNSYTFTNLEAGKTYYFAATTYDAYGNTSDYSQEVSYFVPALNRPPVAQAGSLTLLQDTTGSGTLAASDPDGNPITYTLINAGAQGTAVITNPATGAYTYTPKPNVFGTDSFTFKATDDQLAESNPATITVIIAHANHAPIAQGGSLSLPQDSVGRGTLTASDPDGDALTFAVVAQASLGTVSVNAGTGAYTYTPKSGARGTDSFTLQARDPAGLFANAAVAVTITAVNHAPVAGSSSLTMVQDAVTSGKLIATDADGNVLKYQLVGAATRGTVKLDAAKGFFTYTPNASFTGTDTFTFKANDGTVDSNVASVTITVSAHVKIQLEAEQGTLTSPMTRLVDYGANGGRYITVSNGKGNVLDPLAAGGQALYSFNVPVSGNYVMWGRVASSNTDDNSFFVSMDYAYPLTWHTALTAKDTWAWDQVTDNSGAAPTVFTLEAGTHTLLIKQREDGTKLDSIMITTQPRWIPETVYADAENGAIDGWDVFDADPAGALISNVYEQSRVSQVIELAGSGVNNGYRLRSKSFSNWANSSQLVMAWSIDYGQDFIIYVDVQTSSGSRTLQYEPISTDYLGSKSIVRLGLGTGAKDGQWHTFVRDLQADLNRAQSRVKILSVNSFSIRGSGKVDDIKLRQSL
jgi:VCBS repeat-containing protein